MEKDKEVIKSLNQNIEVPREFIYQLQKYLRLMRVIDPLNGQKIWIIAGKSKS